MLKRGPYSPDYRKLYPCIEKRPDILRELRAGDRKARYIEQQLKESRFIVDPERGIAKFLPPREDSLDRLMMEERFQFSAKQPEVEEQILHLDMLLRLREALKELAQWERELIAALYADGQTEREFAKACGLHYMTIHNRKVKILRKLRKLLDE